MSSEKGLGPGEVESECQRVIGRICKSANVEDLATTIDVILEERARGRIVDPVCASPRCRLQVSKSLWLGARERQREVSVAAAVCYLICTLCDNDPAIRTEGLTELFGCGPVAHEPDWRLWEVRCRKVIEDTYAFLGASELAEKTELKWNGRLRRPAAVCRWDAAAERGTIELAKQNWPLLIEEEQEEVVVHGCCIVLAKAAPELANALGDGGWEYELLRKCGYSTPMGGYALFQGNRYQGGLAVGAPHRIHLHEVLESRRSAGWQG